MSEGQKRRAAPPRERRIIERPRLLNLLADTDARVILLNAPAGYGKTILAQQWLQRGTSATYRAAAASGDVAVFAAGLARAAAEIVRGADERLSDRLKASTEPATDVPVLAEMLGEDLHEWPEQAWLLIDDYHRSGDPESVQIFLETLVRESRIRLLLTSRFRPAWISARSVLYGEVAEIDYGSLAMTEAETAEMLREHEPQVAAEIFTSSRGWPAVVGLASLSRVDAPTDVLPSTLYEFLADELFRAVGEPLRSQLVKLSVLPNLEPRLVSLLIEGPAIDVMQRGRSLGFITTTPTGAYEYHPLLRAFFDERVREDAQLLGAIRGVTTRAIELRLWDEAAELIERFRLDDLLPDLFAATPELFADSRVASVVSWIAHAKHVGAEFPLLELAEAEVARRQGHRDSAEALALQAARGLSTASRFSAWAFSLAGECAYVQQRFEDSLRHHERAETLAVTAVDARRALWGQILAANELEATDLKDRLQRFEAMADTSAEVALRLGVGRIITAARSGGTSDVFDRVARDLPLVDRARDPLATTAFLYRLGYAAIMAARYVEAVNIVGAAAARVSDAKLTFALGHIEAAHAHAYIGMRQFRRAEFHLRAIERHTREVDDLFERHNARTLWARLWIGRNDFDRALGAVDVDPADVPSTALQGEFAALAAIASAANGAYDHALRLAEFAESVTREVQPVSLAALARAIVAERTKTNEAALVRAAEVLRVTQCDDSLVCAYRAWPWLLPRLTSVQGNEVRIRSVVERAADIKLATTVGLTFPDRPIDERLELLSRREHEVFQLVAQGMTNREIAHKLVLSEATVKLHVRHILAKVGARSRTEALALVREPST